ncbi:MAG: hypothetical protein AAF621_07195 [Pseudomonadota bacterium]
MKKEKINILEEIKGTKDENERSQKQKKLLQLNIKIVKSALRVKKMQIMLRAKKEKLATIDEMTEKLKTNLGILKNSAEKNGMTFAETPQNQN